MQITTIFGPRHDFYRNEPRLDLEVHVVAVFGKVPRSIYHMLHQELLHLSLEFYYEGYAQEKDVKDHSFFQLDMYTCHIVPKHFEYQHIKKCQ